MRVALLATLLALGTAGTLSAQTQPLLQLQGQPYFGGSMKLSLSGVVGQPALLAYGLNPLTTPLQTGKGAWYIGGLVNLVAIGSIPTAGRIDLPFTMPPTTPALAGIPIVMQGYVPSQLSNPATLPLDLPYLLASNARMITSPQPQVQAMFGDTLAVGDLNGDGHDDLIVGAWFEDWQGVDKSGRVYVFWGPEFDQWVGLESANPKPVGHFGEGLAVADLDRDGIDDLIVAEATGNPPVPGEPGRLHVFWGGSAWSATPGLDIESAGTGAVYVLFGRTLTVGDYNGDTWPDIAVGIDMATVGGLSNAGRIDVYWGPDWGTRTEITSPDNGADNFFGSALASGDINGDQIDDLVEGSGRDDVGGITNLGSAHLFLGPALQLFTTLVAPMPSGINTRFGDAVHVLHTDEPLGASVVVFDLKNHGFLYPPDSLSSPSVLWKPMADAQVPVSQTLFGALLAEGDVNGDGRRDILISDCFEGDWSGCSPLGGGGRLYFSLAPYFASFLLLHDVVEECGAEFGWRSATGDLDGDGRIDVVVGARDSDAGGIQNSGHVVVFFSNVSG
jgi:hypothetical protein